MNTTHHPFYPLGFNGELFRVALGFSLGLLLILLFASRAIGATATVNLGTADSFSVLAGSTVTNTGPTIMSGDLGLSPGSSVTGAPVVLGQTHVDDHVAIGAKNDLTTAYNDAAARPSNGSAGTELAGQSFTPGTYSATSSLLLSSGSVTLNAQGDPNAVFIFQVGSTLTTGSNTSVHLAGGAQACNVFWQVGSSATLGTGTQFVGTVMALASVTANTGATIQGRLLAQTAAVNLNDNVITTTGCAAIPPGSTPPGSTPPGSTPPGGSHPPGSTPPGGRGPGSSGPGGASPLGPVSLRTKLCLAKTEASRSVPQGGRESWTIRVRNCGRKTAYNVVITDMLLPGITLVSLGHGALVNGQLVWYVGALRPGQLATVHLSARFDANAPLGISTNRARTKANNAPPVTARARTLVTSHPRPPKPVMTTG